jgi:hypothetical protein
MRISRPEDSRFQEMVRENSIDSKIHTVEKGKLQRDMLIDRTAFLTAIYITCVMVFVDKMVESTFVMSRR